MIFVFSHQVANIDLFKILIVKDYNDEDNADDNAKYDDDDDDADRKYVADNAIVVKLIILKMLNIIRFYSCITF